jgi:tetratricopeptide (TPR) repeat protein
MSVAAKRGQAALRYLNRLPSLEQGTLPVQLLRAQALYLSGQQAAATDLLAQVEKQAPADPQVAFSIGLIFVDWQRYADAENAFTRALDADPTNFDILYNLALAAQHAGRFDRAPAAPQRCGLPLQPGEYLNANGPHGRGGCAADAGPQRRSRAS